MNEFIEQFIIESREHVELANAALTALEGAPRDPGALETLFRSLHTLKGSAGIVDFGAMEELLHTLETALAPVRGDAPLSARLNAECLACLDLVVRWLDAMERSGEVPAGAGAQTATLLARLGESGKTPRGASAAEAGAKSGLPPAARALLEAQTALLAESGAGDEIINGRIASAARTAASVLAWCGLGAQADQVARAADESLAQRNPDPLRECIAQALRDESPAPQPARAAQTLPELSTRTLRIDASRVEALVRLVGELTVIKNAIGHTAGLAQSVAHTVASSLKDQHAVLDRITSEIQGTVLAMRVLPLRTVFGRFPPVVREMAASLGKPARLIIEGDDTEADKAIVEMLFEPLLHVVRNAMDHGIEAPASRARAGKPHEATLVMRASRHGDRVVIEVEDDGAGIDATRVRELALERGIVSAEALAELPEADVINLVFASGFSTAEKITELSGRGVGMDAVRAAVGSLHGSVSLESQAGHGTTVRFSLPFSVMLTQVMTVEAGGQTFGIPLDAVVETIRVPVDSLSGVGAAHAVAHRERTLPVFDLANLLNVQGRENRPKQSSDEAVIVVVAFAGQWGGIRVDRPGGRMEVMLKPLDGLLAGLSGITGTTIMGDGRVLLVLDLAEILM